MASKTPKTYLIAGATRGIGRGLVASLLRREKSIVIAGVRNPRGATAESLGELHRGEGSKLIVVGIDAESYVHFISPSLPCTMLLMLSICRDTSACLAISTLQSTHSITHLDVVIANAGKAQSFIPTASLDMSLARELFEINTLGPLRLFQAVLPLLKPGAKFLVMSSATGSIAGALEMPFGVGAYGMSKAAVNYLVAKGMADSSCVRDGCGADEIRSFARTFRSCHRGSSSWYGENRHGAGSYRGDGASSYHCRGECRWSAKAVGEASKGDCREVPGLAGGGSALVAVLLCRDCRFRDRLAQTCRNHSCPSYRKPFLPAA